jgi:hypothetical protein
VSVPLPTEIAQPAPEPQPIIQPIKPTPRAQRYLARAEKLNRNRI